MHMNIFNDDAFSAVSMTEALEDYEYKPGLISAMVPFDTVPLTTEFVSVERRGNTLSLIPTSERGAPLAEGKVDGRNLRAFKTTRIAKGHTLQASAIQNIRSFGNDSELETALEFIGRYSAKLMGEMELTWENQKLGAVQGKVLDADGSVIVDWFDEWGITRPAIIDFALDTETTSVEAKCTQVIRTMQDAAGANWSANTEVIGLAGDSFFDKLRGHNSIKETVLNTNAAQQLNRFFGLANGSRDSFRAGSYATFVMGGITFINYRGAFGFDKAAAEGVRSGKQAMGVRQTRCKFFPINLPGLFQQAFAPGESWEWANTLGRPVYELLIRDDKRNFWVRPEIYSYPLFICTLPELLLEARENATA